MSDQRKGAIVLGLTITAIALAWTGDWLFDHSAGAIPATSAYGAAATALLFWLGFFGSRMS